VCVCFCVFPPIVARQRLGRNVTAVPNIHATIEELLDAPFSMWSVSYQKKQAISFSQNFLFTRIREMLGSNLCQDTGYPV
jgi:hypothetical protein